MKSAATVLHEAKFARTFITAQDLNYSWEKALELLEKEGRTYDFDGSSRDTVDSDTESSD